MAAAGVLAALSDAMVDSLFLRPPAPAPPRPPRLPGPPPDPAPRLLPIRPPREPRPRFGSDSAEPGGLPAPAEGDMDMDAISHKRGLQVGRNERILLDFRPFRTCRNMEKPAFDAAMFGMKQDHGTAAASSTASANTPSGTSSGRAPLPQQAQSFRGNSNGYGRGNSRGGGHRGGRGRGRGRGGGGSSYQRGGPLSKVCFDQTSYNTFQAYKQRLQRQRTDDNSTGRGFFKPSMLEDPWAHLS